jgi:hypothetical protein
MLKRIYRYDWQTLSWEQKDRFMLKEQTTFEKLRDQYLDQERATKIRNSFTLSWKEF